jgi:hypothetical protein
MIFLIAFLVEAILTVILLQKSKRIFPNLSGLDKDEYKLKALMPLGMFIVTDIMKRKFDSPKDMATQSKLAQLYGSRDAAARLRLNAAKKMSIAVLGVLLITLLAGAYDITHKNDIEVIPDEVNVNGNVLERPEFGEGSKETRLEATYKIGEIEETYSYDIKVGQQIPSDEECVKWVSENLESSLLNGNESLDKVTKDLKPAKTSTKTGAVISWETSDASVVDDEGKITRKENGKGSGKATLTATVKKGEAVATKAFKVVVLEAEPLSEVQQLAQAKENVNYSLEQAAAIDRAGETTLLTKYKDVEVTWEKPEPAKNHKSITLFIVGLIFLALLIYLSDRNIDGEIKKRKQMILIDYPSFLNKLSILIMSGMNLPKSFEKIAHDYQTERERGTKQRPLYEEIVRMVEGMNGGAVFTDALNDFASRCKTREILKLASILDTSQKRGGGDLVSTLKTQSVEAWESRKSVAKRKGEEASTKLLFPLLLMLGAVLIIVMVPAFMSITGSM